jgi:hypothetical protein
MSHVRGIAAAVSAAALTLFAAALVSLPTVATVLAGISLNGLD